MICMDSGLGVPLSLNPRAAYNNYRDHYLVTRVNLHEYNS